MNTPAIGADGTVYITSSDKSLYSFGGSYPTCSPQQGIIPVLTSVQVSSPGCRSCGIGQYALRSICNLCPTGFFSNATGVSTCGACTPGSFNPQRGSTNCTSCAKGTFTNSPGNSICKLCAFGTISVASGSTGCTDCQSGSFANNGSAQCNICTAGQFSQQVC